jgi:hypothetical protein
VGENKNATRKKRGEEAREVGLSWNQPLEGLQGDSRVLSSVTCLSELPDGYYHDASTRSHSACCQDSPNVCIQKPPITQERAELPDFITDSQYQGNPQLLPLARFPGNSPKCLAVLDKR